MDDDDWLDWEERRADIPLFHHMIAGKYFSAKVIEMSLGSCAGIVEHVGTFPMDTIKVSILQLGIGLTSFLLTDPYAGEWPQTRHGQHCKNSIPRRGTISLLEGGSSDG